MSLRCDNVRDFVSVYYDGAVSENTEQDIKEHLHKCKSCREFYRDYKKVMEQSRKSRGDQVFSKNFSALARRMKKHENIKITAVAGSLLAAVSTTLLIAKLVFEDDGTEE